MEQGTLDVDAEIARKKQEVEDAIEEYGFSREDPGATLIWFGKEYMNERFETTDDDFRRFILKRFEEEPWHYTFKKFAALNKVYNAHIQQQIPKGRSPLSTIIHWGKWKGHEFRVIYQSTYRWNWYMSHCPKYKPLLLEMLQQYRLWKASRPKRKLKEKRIVGLHSNPVGEYESDGGFVVMDESSKGDETEQDDEGQSQKDDEAQDGDSSGGDWESSENETGGSRDGSATVETSGIEGMDTGEAGSGDDGNDLLSLDDLLLQKSKDQRRSPTSRARQNRRTQSRCDDPAMNIGSSPDSAAPKTPRQKRSTWKTFGTRRPMTPESQDLARTSANDSEDDVIMSARVHNPTTREGDYIHERRSRVLRAAETKPVTRNLSSVMETRLRSGWYHGVEEEYHGPQIANVLQPPPKEPPFTKSPSSWAIYPTQGPYHHGKLLLHPITDGLQEPKQGPLCRLFRKLETQTLTSKPLQMRLSHHHANAGETILMTRRQFNGHGNPRKKTPMMNVSFRLISSEEYES
ncbi:uncharacterized protein LY89DRAFT_725369 [Mollisia scopiformis]|uniref:Uncharacterized protein n=1 Tax=Mollisia scopiformis TaxID=149040 RepID=A0A132B6K3_MOLSC|nr:uncharacterized protein LY89DRAFT_725369 [Mollisia scopiformis]KUJ08036.1 hypothetical protein LY89DRAFT_725369 [Mollisia scopiformis]